MAEHGVAISLSNASPSSSSSSDHHTLHTTGSSSHRRPPPSPVAVQSQPVQQHTITPQSKKPRGRPPGSKNKPKATMMVAPGHEFPMKPIVIDVAPGNDIVESVVAYARRRHLNLTLLSASGTVAYVTLCHALTQAPAFNLHGPFAIMGLSGTYLYNSHFAPSPSSPNGNSSYSFGITLSGNQGQVFGGIIGGKAVAGSSVSVTATTFKKAEFYKVPAGGTEEKSNDNDSNDNDNDNDNHNNNNNNHNNPNACDHGAGNDNMTGFNVVTCHVSGW
ncbi:hypothetical protein VNO77_42802 [Canavalia gladiata]|uniref:AT-hook motif nuclear-localized protein n=1 Tax=Canavalia gladiata TaxID=3824 RepID=A0AAN9PPG9_CANGL